MRESLEDGCLACSSFGNPELLRDADSLKLSGLQTLLKVPGSTCVANTARAALKDVQAVALITQRRECIILLPHAGQSGGASASYESLCIRRVPSKGQESFLYH
jgi:hypothetical protein